MKIKIEKNKLEQVLNQIVPFTDKKDFSQITSHILIKANEENLILKATDKEIGVKKIIKAKIEEEGTITINGKKILEIIKTLKNKQVEIKSTNDIITISQDKSKYTLTSFDYNQFPNFPKEENLNKLDIKIKTFEQIIKRIFPVIDNNNPKYELNGALFNLKEKSEFVSTDTKRLAVYKTDINSKEEKIIIPKRALSEIKKILSDDMEIFFNNIFLIIKNKETTLFTRIINGNFPNYEKLINENTTYKITLNTKEFLEEIKKIEIISNHIKITIKNNLIEIESISDESLKANTLIEIENTQIEEFTFGVNSKYLIEFLNSIDEEKFQILLNTPNTPFILKENENFLTVVMPLTI